MFAKSQKEHPTKSQVITSSQSSTGSAMGGRTVCHSRGQKENIIVPSVETVTYTT
mgnify:CR=1 FL=1